MPTKIKPSETPETPAAGGAAAPDTAAQKEARELAEKRARKIDTRSKGNKQILQHG